MCNEISNRAGLYIHIPYCSRICPYCDFSTARARDEIRLEFTKLLCQEIKNYSGHEWTFDSIYFGGGTPSILSPQQLGMIINALHNSFSLTTDARIHFEANPEDATEEKLNFWRQTGVHMISFGVQSLSERELGFLKRVHSKEQAIAAIQQAQQFGFPTISIDLMYGLPKQSLEIWQESLAQAVRLEPDHLSCYQLTIHDGTPFARRKKRGRLVELDNDAQGDFFEFTHSYAEDHGYHAYELSNFATKHIHQSVHNQKYWYHIPYLGLGPSAHSFSNSGPKPARWWNVTSTKDYVSRMQLDQSPILETEELNPLDLALEALLLRLRTKQGFKFDSFASEYQFDVRDKNASLIEDCMESGYFKNSQLGIFPTISGLAVADGLAAKFEF